MILCAIEMRNRKFLKINAGKFEIIILIINYLK
jgi:hypothetical protein